MKKINYLQKIIMVTLAISVIFLLVQASSNKNELIQTKMGNIKLPKPKYNSNISVEEAILKRRSIRSFKDEPVTLSDVSQLLWASQGITDSRGLRTAPSAGATYPLEVYVLIGNVVGIKNGLYKYLPQSHEITRVNEKDLREALSNAALGQIWIKKCPVVIVFTAVYERTTQRYGNRGIRYVHMEVGHAAQNVHLQVISLNLGTFVVGAFGDEEVKNILKLPENEHPLYILPVGKIRN